MVIGRNLLSIRELERLAYEEGDEFDPAEATSPGLAMESYSHTDEALAALAETVKELEKDKRWPRAKKTRATAVTSIPKGRERASHGRSGQVTSLILSIGPRSDRQDRGTPEGIEMWGALWRAALNELVRKFLFITC